MSKVWEKGNVIWVYDAGNRGTHSCTAVMKVEVYDTEKDAGNIIRVTGKVLNVTACNRCGGFEGINVGDIVTYSGWYDPEYYGHDGLQL